MSTTLKVNENTTYVGNFWNLLPEMTHMNPRRPNHEK